jgi:hypothetical protein
MAVPTWLQIVKGTNNITITASENETKTSRSYPFTAIQDESGEDVPVLITQSAGQYVFQVETSNSPLS